MSDRKKPKYPTLAHFLAAHSRGDIPREAHLIVSTCSCEVTIVCPIGERDAEDIANDDDTREEELLVRSPAADTFAVSFARAFGMRGDIA